MPKPSPKHSMSVKYYKASANKITAHRLGDGFLVLSWHKPLSIAESRRIGGRAAKRLK